MSSAILYLAIIAIWAGVLIPRWLKRDTSQAPGQPEEDADSRAAETDHDAQADGADEDMARSDAYDTDAYNTDTGDRAGPTEPTAPRMSGSRSADRRDFHPDRRDGHADRPTGRGDARESRRPSRKRMLAARRRMLIVLCVLTVAALGIALTGLGAWWVAVPPAIMLAGYLMLLREVRRADAEHALLEAAAYRDEQQWRYAHTLAQSFASAPAQESSARALAATARVIDISERVRDELYDQYADGERRAVGD